MDDLGGKAAEFPLYLWFMNFAWDGSEIGAI